MTAAKRKLSVTLDADLVAELGEVDEALSKQVNDAVRDALERRRRHRLLDDLCAELDGRLGPVSEKLIQKYQELLG
jgi:antitoxin CcdA